MQSIAGHGQPEHCVSLFFSSRPVFLLDDSNQIQLLTIAVDGTMRARLSAVALDLLASALVASAGHPATLLEWVGWFRLLASARRTLGHCGRQRNGVSSWPTELPVVFFIRRVIVIVFAGRVQLLLWCGHGERVEQTMQRAWSSDPGQGNDVGVIGTRGLDKFSRRSRVLCLAERSPCPVGGEDYLTVPGMNDDDDADSYMLWVQRVPVRVE